MIFENLSPKGVKKDKSGIIYGFIIIVVELRRKSQTIFMKFLYICWV